MMIWAAAVAADQVTTYQFTSHDRDLLDNAAQFLDAGKVERGGRLVEQQHGRVGRQGLDDLEELALGGVEATDERVGRNVEVSSRWGRGM